MVRKTLVCLLVQGGLLAVSTGLEGVAVAQSSPGEVGGGLEPSIFFDDFDDNEQSESWRVYVDDANTCQMVETNGRLELRALEHVQDAFAGYVADAWRFDAGDDFAIRVDYHYDLQTFPKGRINIGLTPSEEDPRTQRLDFGVGCADLFPSYWYESRNDSSVRSAYIDRGWDDGTLFISYDALADALYLGDAGYGPEYAWMTVTDLLGDQWEGKPVYLYLGGSASGLEIASGHAYLDNLLVEKGTVIESTLKEVYRFWSPATATHFYTISEDERDKLLAGSAEVWTYEGAVFQAYSEGSDPASRPVYRFWSGKLGSHFYTILEDEKNWLIAEYADVWSYEGPVFYAYPADQYPTWASPVYRFWSPVRQTHFYTISVEERDLLMTEFSDVWIPEGIAWYTKK